MDLIGNEEFTADDKEQDDTCQNIRKGLIQSEGCKISLAPLFKNTMRKLVNAMVKGFKFCHPGNHNSRKSLTVCNGGRNCMVDSAYQKKSYHTTDRAGKAPWYA